MARKIYALLPVLIVLSLLLMCCGGGGKSPKDIPRAFYDAMLQGDVVTLQEFTTGKTTEEAIDGIDEAKKLNITISDFKVLEVKDMGEGKADVRIEFVHEESPEGGKYRKKQHEQVFHLIQVEGRWVLDKVDDVSTKDITEQ